MRTKNWIKQIRMAKGFTQKALADKIGLTHMHISRLERGVTDPTVTMAKKVANALNIDWVRFFEEEEEKQSTASAPEQKEATMNDLLRFYPFNLVRDVLLNDEDALKIYIPGVLAALDTLPERHADTLRKRYRDNMTLQAIGEIYNVVRERVRQLEAQSLNMLRRPSRLNMIKAVSLSAVIKQNTQQEEKHQKLSHEYVPPVRTLKTSSADIAQTPIEELELSTRSYRSLKRADKKTVRDVAEMSREELANIAGLGVKSVNEVVVRLKQHGIRIRDFSDAISDETHTAVLCAQFCQWDNSAPPKQAEKIKISNRTVRQHRAATKVPSAPDRRRVSGRITEDVLLLTRADMQRKPVAKRLNIAKGIVKRIAAPQA